MAGGGVAAQEQLGAEGVARCAFESATRLDSLDVHSLQLEANLARIAHESAARDRQMSQVEPWRGKVPPNFLPTHVPWRGKVPPVPTYYYRSVVRC